MIILFKNKVVFADANREEIIKDEIRINIRGKPPLTIPFSVSTIIPKVYVLQEEFDFGFNRFYFISYLIKSLIKKN